MGLKKTLTLVHKTLSDAGIEHALIGGLGLSALGIHRATFDVDLLIEGSDRTAAMNALVSAGWHTAMETEEVLHFEGKGQVDVLLANRPPTREMLKSALKNEFGIKNVRAEGIIGLKIQAYKNNPKRELQDKADIVSIIDNSPNLDWVQIKSYADVFDEWPFIESIRKKK